MGVPKEAARDADGSSHDGSLQAAAEAGQKPKDGAAPGRHREAARRRARSAGGGALMEWCNKWLKNPPEGDPKEHERMARADLARYAQKALDEDMEEDIEADIEARIDARIDERMKRYDEEMTERQIMVDNFKVFERDYINMAIRRSC